MTRQTTPADAGENLPVGAVIALFSFACLAVMSAFAKVAGSFAPTIVIVFFQNLICLIFIAPVALRHGFAPLKTKRIPMHLFRAATGSVAWFALFLAISMMPLSNAVLLTYSAPLWMPLIAWFVSRKKIAGRLWIGMVLGFVGIVLVLNPDGTSFNIGALFAIGGAILLAFALMSVRWLSTTEPTQRILFYYFLFSSVMILPFAVVSWTTVEPVAWIYMIAIGLCLLGTQVAIVLAYQKASAVKLGPLIYSVIVFTALINWLIWGQAPTLLEVLGMALVIAGGLVAVVRTGGSNTALSA